MSEEIKLVPKDSRIYNAKDHPDHLRGDYDTARIYSVHKIEDGVAHCQSWTAWGALDECVLPVDTLVPHVVTYKIVRFFERETPPRYNRIIAEGLTLEEAQKHCSDPDTSSHTCTSEEGMELTEKYGPWFDGFHKEEE